MSVSDELGAPRTVRLSVGEVAYRERGEGPPLVFVHGVGVNGDLWRDVAPKLADDHRCIVPDWPLGAHSHGLAPDADLSLPGLAGIAAELLEALDLDEVTVVANDTGGAIAQMLVGSHPQRVGRLVLTSCDAFDRFPPRPQLYLKAVARSRTAMWMLSRLVQVRWFQRLPLAYGWVTKRPIDAARMRSFTRPIRDSARVRRDLTRLLRAVDTRYTYEAANALPRFDKPAVVVWAADDKIFPRVHGQLLAELLPQARFEMLPRSRTFIPVEQPELLVDAVRRFLSDTTP